MITRKILIRLLTILLLTPVSIEAQQAKKVFRVGILENVDSPRTEAFRRGMRDRKSVV